jgi:hypothetical protein
MALTVCFEAVGALENLIRTRYHDLLPDEGLFVAALLHPHAYDPNCHKGRLLFPGRSMTEVLDHISNVVQLNESCLTYLIAYYKMLPENVSC